jgi:hypothetical protein
VGSEQWAVSEMKAQKSVPLLRICPPPTAHRPPTTAHRPLRPKNFSLPQTSKFTYNAKRELTFPKALPLPHKRINAPVLTAGS